LIFGRSVSVIVVALAVSVVAQFGHAGFRSNAVGVIAYPPTGVDTDGDGTDDANDTDIDGDGLVNSIPLPLSTDADACPYLSDCDFDGLDDADEISRGTNPQLADTDGDGISDGDEVASGSDPLIDPADSTIASFDAVTPFTVDCPITTPGTCVATGTVPRNATAVSVTPSRNGVALSGVVAAVNGTSFSATIPGVNENGGWSFVAQASGAADQSAVDSVPVSYSVNVFLPQPSDAAVSTPSGGLFVGGTYTLGVANQGGSGAVAWTASQASIDAGICSVTPGGLVTAGTTAGNCEVQASVAADGRYLASTLDPATIVVSQLQRLDPLDTDQIDWRLDGRHSAGSATGWPVVYAGSNYRIVYVTVPAEYEGAMSISDDSCSITSSVAVRPSNASQIRFRITPPATAPTAPCELEVTLAEDLANGYEEVTTNLSVAFTEPLARVNTDGTAFVDNKPPTNNCLAGQSNASTDSLNLQGGTAPFKIKRHFMSWTGGIDQYRSYVRVLENPPTVASQQLTCTELGYPGARCRGLYGAVELGETMEASLDVAIAGRRVDMGMHWVVPPLANSAMIGGNLYPIGLTGWVEIVDAGGAITSANLQLECDTINTGTAQAFAMNLDASALDDSATYTVPNSAFSTTSGGVIDVTLSSLTPNACSVSGMTITALAGNATCRISAENAGFTAGSDTYAPATVTGSIVIDNDSTALGWNDGSYVWSNCQVVDAMTMSASDVSDVRTVNCPTGKEHAPGRLVDLDRCDGAEAWSYSQPVALGNMFASDKIWQNGGNGNSTLHGNSSNFVATIRTHREFGLAHFTAMNRGNRVQVKVCANKN
jgi:hypothetical protein